MSINVSLATTDRPRRIASVPRRDGGIQPAIPRRQNPALARRPHLKVRVGGSMSINRVILIGNLGRDPEMRAFPSGDRIANVSLATTEKWRDRQSGEPREHTEWHRLVFNGRLVDVVEKYLRKGSQIYVEGSIRTRKWQGQDGQDRYSTEVRVDQMQMLGSRQGGGSAAPADDGWGALQTHAAPSDSFDGNDDIPF